MCDWISKGRMEEAETNEGKRSTSYNAQSDIAESEEEDFTNHLVIAELDGGFSVWCRTSIQWQQSHLTHNALLHFNMLPLRVVGRSMQQQLARLLNRLNASNRLGSFYLNFQTGTLHYRSSKCFTLPNQDMPRDKQEEVVVKIIEKVSSASVQLIDERLNQILAVANLTELQKKRTNWSDSLLLSPRSLKSIERVNQYLQMTDTDLNEILEEFVSQRQPSHMHLDINSLERIYNIVSDRGAEHLRRQCWSFTTYSDYLEIEEDVTNLEWKEFYQGETYRVARASDICVYAMRNNCPEIYGPEASRNLIRKVQHNGGIECIQNEEHVYRTLNSNTRNPNLVKPIYCKHTQTNAFIIEQYGEQSLKKFLTSNQQTCSLQTKLCLLIQVAKGLRALYIRNILYLNLKNSNVVVGKNLGCQLSDMSYAIVLKAEQEDVEAPARYLTRFDMSTPEVSDHRYSRKTDVYFMGKLMLAVLLNLQELPLDRLVKLIEIGAHSRIIYHLPELMVSRELTLQYFPSFISEQLMELCWKCVTLQPTQRPTIEWVIAILSEVKSSLQFEM